MATILSIDLIQIDPAIRGGRPYIAGTTVTVADVAAIKLFQQLEGDALASWFNLSLAQVYAALSYYYAHKNEIDRDIREQEALAQAYKERRIGSRHLALLK